MRFPWSRDHHLLAEPFPSAWLGYLQSNVSLYQTLPAEEQERLRDDLRLLVAHKSWEGCRGLALTEEMQVTIAAQACLLLLGFEGRDLFPNVESILLYPAGYVATARTMSPGGVIYESESARLGEAWSRGPVILSWPDALAGGRNAADGRNVVLHEFAHKLDFRDGAADGVPPLPEAGQYETWASVMSAEYAALVAQSQAGQETLLDWYGATDAAEFFAVATECFFEKPADLAHSHPALYEVLRSYYRQDPAQRGQSRGAALPPCLPCFELSLNSRCAR